MFIKKVLNKFFVLIKSKFYFFKPEKKEILVYDKEGDNFELLKENLKNFEFNSLDVRQKELNIYILFKTVFNFSNNRTFFENYFIITLLITIGIQLSCFVIAYKFNSDKVSLVELPH